MWPGRWRHTGAAIARGRLDVRANRRSALLSLRLWLQDDHPILVADRAATQAQDDVYVEVFEDAAGRGNALETRSHNTYVMLGSERQHRAALRDVKAAQVPAVTATAGSS